MVDRAWLRPVSVREPPQGDFSYLPIVRAFEDTTLAGLNSQLDASFGVQSQSVQELWVLEEIEYQVSVTKPAIGGMPAELHYSALIWATKVERV